MNPLLKRIEKEARKLSPQEREELASRLFDSVHHQELTDVDKAWLSVVEERYHAYNSGQDQGIDEASFFSQIKEDLEW